MNDAEENLYATIFDVPDWILQITPYKYELDTLSYKLNALNVNTI